MKNLFKIFSLLAVITLVVVGCKKDENRIFFDGGTAPVFSASKTAVVLTPATEPDLAIQFNWTNPNYQFTTGISSHDVQYALEFDVNNNFNSDKKFVTTVSKDLSRSFTVAQLNTILGNSMLLPFGQNVTIFVRVVSSLRFEGSANGLLASNAVSFTTSPFAPPPAVAPPTTDRLVLVGNGSPGGWDNSAGNTQVFTRVSSTVYELTITLNGGNTVLFLPLAGSWDDKYGFDGANNENNVNGDKLSRGGGDIKVPATTGTYKITVNFQTGRFTFTPQ